MQNTKMIVVGGWAMILAALLFCGIGYLVDLLPADGLYSLENHGLLKIVAGSDLLNKLISLYAIVPLLLIPAAVSTFYAFRKTEEAMMHVGIYFAIVGMLGILLSLMMLPSLSWMILTDLPALPVSAHPATIVILKALHNYFGIYIGDILGVGCLLVWFFLTSLAMIRATWIPSIIGTLEILITVFGAAVLGMRYIGYTPLVHMYITMIGIISLWLFICGFCFVFLKKEW